MSALRPESGAPDRLRTGSDALDAVLHGGLPRYGAVVITGVPGSGKTILSQQIAFANAQAGRTCLCLSTLAEPPLTMLRVLQGFTFFHPDLIATNVWYADLGTALRKDGLAGVLAQVDDLVREHRPALVVIDSFKGLRTFIRDPVAFHAFTFDVLVQLSVWEVTALLVGAYTPEEVREGVEFVIADGIIALSCGDARERPWVLRVLKMRGTAFVPGAHEFEIDAAGLTLSSPVDSTGSLSHGHGREGGDQGRAGL